jgi:type I restriction enzyme S subunit
MQQIFSQELRFKDDDGQEFPEWEVKTIADIFHRNTHSSKSDFIVNDGIYIVVDMGSISRDARLLITKRANFSNDCLTTNDLVMAKDDIGGGNIIGRVVQIPENNKYICSDHVYKLTIKDGYTQYISYFYYVINSFKVNKSFRQKANGTAQIGISNKTVDDQILPIPTIQEQIKIANFLTAIDEKITNNQTQLDAVKQYKQGLLQQMFV